MFFDNTYHFIEMEQTARPGSIGDSMAETGRYLTLAYVIGDNPKVNLLPFITEKGLLRHPDSPWREDDISSDQVAPFVAAASLDQPLAADLAINRLRKAGNKTGNGDPISIGLRGQIARHQNSKIQWLYDLSYIGQALIFKLPLRWSDSKKRLELSSGSSADYLNFVNGLLFAKAKDKKLNWICRIALKMVGKKKILEKVQDYYKPEPNVQWLLDMYEKGIEVL